MQEIMHLSVFVTIHQSLRWSEDPKDSPGSAPVKVLQN